MTNERGGECLSCLTVCIHFSLSTVLLQSSSSSSFLEWLTCGASCKALLSSSENSSHYTSTTYCTLLLRMVVLVVLYFTIIPAIEVRSVPFIYRTRTLNLLFVVRKEIWMELQKINAVIPFIYFPYLTLIEADTLHVRGTHVLISAKVFSYALCTMLFTRVQEYSWFIWYMRWKVLVQY